MRGSARIRLRTLEFMLLNGVNHVALLTNDTDRLQAFYREIFVATVSRDYEIQPDMRLSFIDIGPDTELNVFQVDGNAEAQRQTPMFGRGRIDHLGLQAASLDAFAEFADDSSTAPPATDSSQTSAPC